MKYRLVRDNTCIIAGEPWCRIEQCNPLEGIWEMFASGNETEMRLRLALIEGGASRNEIIKEIEV